MRSSHRGRAGKIIKTSGLSAAARARFGRGVAGSGESASPPGLGVHESQAMLDAESDEDVAVDDVDYTDLPMAGGDQYSPSAAAAIATSAAALHADMADDDVKHDQLVDEHGAVDPDLNHHHDHMNLNEAANILTNGNAGQDLSALQQHNLHHAHHTSQLMGNSQSPMGGNPHHGPTLHANLDGKTTDMMAAESGYIDLNVESQLAKRLSTWPGARLAQQRRPDQQLNLHRRSNVEALFAHIAGKLAKVQCKNCHKGHGPWNSCVIVEGQMCGSCANCWFNASGARCSFHETRQNVIPTGSASHGHVVDPNGNAYAVPQPILGSQHTARLSSMSMVTAPMTSDPTLRYHIDRAITEVRAADERARHLISIDVAAKQLALQIVAYEDFVAHNGHGGVNGPDSAHMAQQAVAHQQQVAQLAQLQQAHMPSMSQADDDEAA